jgi:acyl dehydratase
MSLEVGWVGRSAEERVTAVDGDRARAYAEATNDAVRAYDDGRLTPPTYGYVVAHEAYRPLLDAVVPSELRVRSVHGEHDMWFHRPLVPGQEVVSRTSVRGIRVGGSGTRITLEVTTVDAGDRLPLLQQYALIFVRGLIGGEDAGEEGPDHAFPEGARAHPVGRRVAAVDDDQATRYAAVTGDRSPIHLDADAARSLGLPGVILHGMCTVALTGQAIVATVGGGDPGRLTRLAVRFAHPVLPGGELVTEMYDAGGAPDGTHAFAFEASSGGRLVATHGCAHLR